MTQIPKISKLLIIGGDEITLEICEFVRLKKKDIFVVSSKRNLMKKIGNKTLKEELVQKKINFCEVSKLNKSKEFTSKYNEKNSLYLLMSCPWILKKKTINSIKATILNSHGTRLPQYRGGANWSWSLMNRVRFGFNNLYLVDDKIDTGRILTFKEFLYPFGLMKPQSYFDFYIRKQISFLKEELGKFFNSKRSFVPKSQVNYFSSYFPRLNTKIHGWVDWSLPFEDLSYFINAFDNPFEGCKTFYKNKIVKIKSTSINYEDPAVNSYKSGMIYRKGPDWICVVANGGSIIIEKVIYKNKNILKELKTGNRFFTPTKYCELKKKRVLYNTKGLKA